MARPSSAPEPNHPPDGVGCYLLLTQHKRLSQQHSDSRLSNRGLNASDSAPPYDPRPKSQIGDTECNPRHLHPGPISLSFTGVMGSRFRAGFELRCFQLLSLTAWLPSTARQDNWKTRGCEPSFLSYWRVLPFKPQHFQSRATNLSHDGLNPSHDPL